ncbi:MAG: aldose 1-epimerase [Chloroflexi bacterium]|nr:aldose 1-epimerase [Chloroflexota bacterium]
MSTSGYAIFPGEGPLGGIVLRNTGTGVWTRVIPEIGANCAELHLRAPSGAVTQVLFSPQSLDQLRASPARSGIPVLFPFPNRIRHGRYVLAGSTYQLRTSDRGHAIHGLVIDQPFRVTHREVTLASATLSCAITSEELERRDGFPFPFELTLTFTLTDSSLTLLARARNTGQGALPLGYGLHPYFPLPLVAAGQRDACLVSLPVTERWELEETLVPTGQRRPIDDTDTLRALRPLGQRSFDGVFTGVVHDADGWSRARLVDPAAGVAVHIEGDPAVREWVLYTPPGTAAISFEPYTCVTDAFNLSEQGVDAGRVVLPPGEEWHCAVRFSVNDYHA